MYCAPPPGTGEGLWACRVLGVGGGDQLQCGHFGAVASDVADEVVFDVVARDPAQGKACGVYVFAAFSAQSAARMNRDLRECLHCARMHARVVEPLHVAVDLLGGAGDTRIQGVRNKREVAAGTQLDAVEFTVGRFDVTVGLIGGLL